METRVAQFIRDHGLDGSNQVATEIVAAFRGEMQAGLAGRPGSLPMIPSYLTTDTPVPAGQPIVVIDAGGTNLRIGVVTFDDAGKPRIEQLTRHRMPGTEAYISADDFFNTLADMVEPVAAAAPQIGFCFSYAAEITPDGDGRLLKWSKQILAPEVEGLMVGSGLAQRLAQRGFQPQITVLNDTVAALLAGKSAGMARRYSSYVGYILGTGTNTACVVANRAITKLPHLDPAGQMIVNLESGGFNRLPRGPLDDQFDATTIDPGAYRLEKMTSGGYLGGIGLVALQAAAQAGLFTPDTATALHKLPRLDNKTLDDFCDNPFLADNELACLPLQDADRRTIQALGNAIYRRAARLAASTLAGVLLEMPEGNDPLAPICVNVDGSTFYRTRSVAFRSRFEAHLRDLVEPTGKHYELIGVDDAPMIGAAVAGLTRNCGT